MERIENLKNKLLVNKKINMKISHAQPDLIYGLTTSAVKEF